MKHCQRSSFLVTASIAVLGLAASADKRMPPEDRKHLLSEKMMTIKSVGAVPVPVKAALAVLLHQTKLVMADPDQPFQAGDAIMPGRTLPGRRLVFAACDDALCVVHYERGGVAHLYFVVALGLEKGKEPAFRWGARVDSKLEDLAALREAVAAGKLHDVANDSW